MNSCDVSVFYFCSVLHTVFLCIIRETALVGPTMPRSTGKVEPMVSAYSCFDDECIYLSSEVNFSDKSQDFVSRIWA